ncbi:CRISPR system precrRNA processing endoribonuclease RAMP protein Cas6 [Leptolyngbya ohadii]|uniref:CRISPR system precrRNA processing endoribonuclease RAMP protein Cas6 n=1 Tax=Leptolyngbya ohadii TaxID=1962290 RepID=UPI000B5A021F|nr:CRISPR system precrRNA processing endoribonuclease RAMP protein Cas6 [Leptolyngbya ohadii]
MEPDNQSLLPRSTALHSLVIRLAAADRGRLPATLGRAIHAQVMHWLSVKDSSLASQIHNSQESPISLSGLIGHRRKGNVQPDDRFYFRISLLDGGLIYPLLAGIEAGEAEPITLAGFPFVLCGIDSLPGTHAAAGSSDYTLLAKTPHISGDITLQFLSPTSFKQKQVTQPFPLPELVFGSLLRRWNTFAPLDLQFSAIEWQGFVSAYELKTYAFKLEGGAEIGAQGIVRYRFPNVEQARVATVLAHFAQFSGVGRKTAMGMGQAKLINS